MIEHETSQRLFDLIRMTHPNEHREPYSRMDVICEISRRGFSVMSDIGFSTDRSHIYKNRYTGEEVTLEYLLSGRKYKTINSTPEEWIFGVIEDWYPVELFEDSKLRFGYLYKHTGEQLLLF